MPEFLSDEGETYWLDRRDAPTRGKVRQYIIRELGDWMGTFEEALAWSIRKVFMRPVWNEEFGCKSGIECEADHPEAVPYWRVET